MPVWAGLMELVLGDFILVNKVKKHTLFLFFTLTFVFTNQVTAMVKSSTKNDEPFLNETEAEAFHQFLHSLNSIEELHITHKNMLTISHYVKSVFIPILNKKPNIKEVHADNPFMTGSVEVAITHQDTTPYRLHITALFNHFVLIGWLLHKKVPANRFLPSATEEILYTLSNLSKLPSDLHNYVLQLVQLNTEILSSIPAHILSTKKGAALLSSTGFAKHFTRFCIAQGNLAKEGHLIESFTLKKKNAPDEHYTNLLLIYKRNRQLLKKCDTTATNLDELDKGIIEIQLLPQNLDEGVSVFVKKHKLQRYSTAQTTESLENLKLHLQSKVRINTLRDISTEESKKS